MKIHFFSLYIYIEFVYIYIYMYSIVIYKFCFNIYIKNTFLKYHLIYLLNSDLLIFVRIFYFLMIKVFNIYYWRDIN